MPKKKKDVLLVFTKGYAGYNAGERATFAAARARQLIDNGVAAEPGTLEKLATAAKKKVTEVTRKPAEVGSSVSFTVDGLGELTGTVVEIASDSIKVEVGEGADTDLYDCLPEELTVLE
jgi:3-oxoacyl-(acyl-carrier-protein) synthase